MKHILIHILFLLFVNQLKAQHSQFVREIYDNWVFSASGGVSYLAMELKKDLTQASMDMNSMPDYVYTVNLYKRVNRKFNLGIDYRKSFFNGYKTYASNIVWLVHSDRFNSEGKKFIPNSVYYATHIDYWGIKPEYNFMNIYSLKRNFLNANFFLNASLGLSYIGVELGFQDQAHYSSTGLSHPLYEKGQGQTKQRDSYGTFAVGTGVHLQLSHRWNFFTEVSLVMVSCDYLDGVHNYTLVTQNDGSKKTYRVGVFDTVGMVSFGFGYQFGFSWLKKKLSPNLWSPLDKGYENEYYQEKSMNKVKVNKLPFRR